MPRASRASAPSSASLGPSASIELDRHTRITTLQLNGDVTGSKTVTCYCLSRQTSDSFGVFNWVCGGRHDCEVHACDSALGMRGSPSSA